MQRAVNGFKKLFSVRTVKDLVKTILYLVCFCIAAVVFWDRQKAVILGQLDAAAGDLLAIWGGLLLALVLTCLACVAAIIVLDVLAEIFLLTKDLKMEKQEVKREYKEQEGNPDVKARRREMHMEVLSAQLKSDVENSSFVVVNPTHIAVAVYFKPVLVPLRKPDQGFEWDDCRRAGYMQGIFAKLATRWWRKENAMQSVLKQTGRSAETSAAMTVAVAAENVLLRRVQHLLAWQFGVDATTINTRTQLFDQLHADSLDLLETVHIMNREFGIEIEIAQLEKVCSVGDLAREIGAMTDKAAA